MKTGFTTKDRKELRDWGHPPTGRFAPSVEGRRVARMVLLAGALAMGLGALALVGCSSTKPEKPREWTEVEKGYVGQWDDGSTLERGTDGGAL